ncbi:hypothetical protein CERZMDRAFT_113469 [Cercospora zeae-maydis SCOH1-5]|uniref:Uncharacterized protein n=1 Tax=Cercospora zeae-maydis SCOH1-5 TaxID=717836 RepID=A0A6A6FA46_9PEZI|nr:hypothetical protein CERZMDRAFT_113469 [Cercospora zeae-maydis SCOH1-5]
MNKFLKKKAADGPTSNEDALRALSQPPSPVLKKSSTNRWKKSKKPEPALVPQLDFTVALPSSDDFRTSLLMPSLSTRFSMLREQDDPKSILGKASDDSVLQPRRRSRMMDFGYTPAGLSDIAEVSSLSGSGRPPFAQTGSSRGNSCMSEDDDASEADNAGSASIMSRSRPGEGNVLFGGRQKIYKISGSGTTSTKSLGKLLYDDDVGMSAFQRYRQRERELNEGELSRPSDESQGFDFALAQPERSSQDDDDARHSLLDDSAKDLCHSPSLSSCDRKRSTTSSDAHSIARCSTAATSIASQTPVSAAPSPAHAPTIGASTSSASAVPADRSNTKPKRLYEQGLDQHLLEQQSTAMSRLTSIQRQRAMSGKKMTPYLHGTKSAGSLHERSQSPIIAFGAQPPALHSPLSPLTTSGIRNAHSGASSPHPGSVPQSPVDEQVDQSSILAQALEPADRGKATAMGAFNKPAQAFDEQQYLERQKQLQRSASSTAAKTKASPSSALQQRINMYGGVQPEPTSSPPEESTRARSHSASQSAPRPCEPTKAYNVFQNAVGQISTHPPVAPANKSPLPDTHRTFFGNISASDDEEDDEETRIEQSFNQPEYGYGNFPSRWQPTILDSVSEHPALRGNRVRASMAEESDEDDAPRALPHAPPARSLRTDADKGEADGSNVLDSPTLGPGAATLGGINTMVHHLRQSSNQSSVYPFDEGSTHDEDAPHTRETPVPSSSVDARRHAVGGAVDPIPSLRDSHSTGSNAWDANETRCSAGPEHGRRSEVRTSDVTRQLDEAIPSWQHQLRGQHTRDGSTATQEGRDAFSRELAARREAVKENLRSVVDVNGSRDHSPAPTPGPGNGGLRAFGMLRSKTSRETLAHGREQPSKPPKALGAMGNHSMSGLNQGDRNAYNVEMARSRGSSSTRLPMPPTSQHPAFKHDPPEGFTDGNSSELPRERQLASARSLNDRIRSRSNSGAASSSRSRSRTRRYPDDFDRNMIDGPRSAVPSSEFTPAASPALVASARSSDESRAGRQGYFEFKNGRPLQSVNTQLANNGPSPSLTPSSIPPNVYGALAETPTPPLSGSSPGDSPSAYAAGVTFPPRTGGVRKRTITKYDISEPTLISSTSNVDTVDLPPGASLKNGMADPPPIPPINPRRKGTTRKLFGLGAKEQHDSGLPQGARSDSNPSLPTSPMRDAQIMSANVLRLQAFDQPMATAQPALRALSPDPTSPTERTRAPVRGAAADGGMF